VTSVGALHRGVTSRCCFKMESPRNSDETRAAKLRAAAGLSFCSPPSVIERAASARARDGNRQMHCSGAFS
jgi:hypothetical protein